MSKWKWKWRILSFWHSRFSTVQEHEWCGFVATHCIYLCRMITGFELLTPSLSGFGKQFDRPWKFFTHGDDFDGACSLLWNLTPLIEFVVMVLRFIFFSCVVTIFIFSPYVRNNCLNLHLARGHSTTSGDNAVTVFQYLSISETCVNQGALYINWLSPSPINEDPGVAPLTATL